MEHVEVSIGFLQSGETYLLQRRPAEPRIGAAGLIGAFGGKVEPGESPVDAVAREIGEETTLCPSTQDCKPNGVVLVDSDLDSKSIAVTANVYTILVDRIDTIHALEGDTVSLTKAEALMVSDQLTSATKAAFEQLL